MLPDHIRNGLRDADEEYRHELKAICRSDYTQEEMHFQLEGLFERYRGKVKGLTMEAVTLHHQMPSQVPGK